MWSISGRLANIHFKINSATGVQLITVEQYMMHVQYFYNDFEYFVYYRAIPYTNCTPPGSTAFNVYSKTSL